MGSYVGEQVGLQHLHLALCRESLQILMRAGQGARVGVGGDDLAYAAAGQHGGQHASAGANVKRQQLGRFAQHDGQRGFGDQANVFAAHRGKNAVVRVNAVVVVFGLFAKSGQFYAIFTPFVGADDA